VSAAEQASHLSIAPFMKMKDLPERAFAVIRDFVMRPK
jgi:hypothetical protein